MRLKMNEKHLTSSHKRILKGFFRTIICKNLSRNEIIDHINDKFKSFNLEPIYSKTKLSNAISNIRFNERKNNGKEHLKIKIREESKFIKKNSNKILKTSNKTLKNSKNKTAKNKRICKKNTEKEYNTLSSIEIVQMNNHLLTQPLINKTNMFKKPIEKNSIYNNTNLCRFMILDEVFENVYILEHFDSISSSEDILDSLISSEDIFDTNDNSSDNICEDIQNCEELPIF